MSLPKSLLALGVASVLPILAIIQPAQAAGLLQADSDALAAFQQARQALAEQQLDEAEILLERVLMLAPEHAEARLELALLLARRGRADTAQLLIQSLIDDPRTDPAHRVGLERLASSLRQPTVPQNSASAKPAATDPAPLYRAEINLTASSNPLARTAASDITFTLPDGPIKLPLDTQPVGGSIVGASLSRTDGPSGAELSVQQTKVTDASRSARWLAWGELPKLADLTGLQWYAQGQQGFDGLRHYTGGIGLPWGLQRISLARYNDSGQADQGLVLRYDRRSPAFLGADWLSSLERGVSTSKAQGYWRAGISTELALAEGSKLLAQWTAQNDTYGYSALLENDAKRRLVTAYVAIEQQVLLGHEKQLVFRAYTGERRGNLDIFSYRDVGIQVALQQHWR
jgi:hypothetical protein